MTFTASYAGTCEACGERFGPGAEIEHATPIPLELHGRPAGHAPAYVHAVCPPSAIDQQRAACPTCFLELPVSGVCGECS